MTKIINVSIIGASGYTGAELIRILCAHPHVKIVSLIADSSAGQPIAAIYPHLRPFSLPDVISIDKASWDTVDAVFCCLPHGTSHSVITSLPKHLKVIDLSADFRLRDIETYKAWYGDHKAVGLQKEAIYGLTELYREEIQKARLVACPGCYPTCATLPLIPLLEAGLIRTNTIIIDAKSGISGAGRSSKQGNLFCEVNENVKPYSINAHRHIPEIEQTLKDASGTDVLIEFSPQVVPLSRGMLATIYVELKDDTTEQDIHTALSLHYQHEPFVHIAPEGVLPTTRDVMGTNICAIGVTKGRIPKRAVIVSTIDNLTKGASGQAVQNFNCVFGFPETTGLLMLPIFP